MGIISPWTSKAMTKVMDAADIRSGSKVLEIGCGSGEASKMIAKRYGCEVTGVDKSHEMIAEAAGNKQRGGGPAFALEDFDALEKDGETVFVQGEYDIIFSECTLSLSKDRRKLLAKIEKALAPGGKLVTIDVCGFKDGRCDTEELVREAETAGLMRVYEEDLSRELTEWAAQTVFEFGSLEEYFLGVTPSGEDADSYGAALQGQYDKNVRPGYALDVFTKAEEGYIS